MFALSLSAGHYIYADGTDGVKFDYTSLESPSFVSNGSGIQFYYHIFNAFHKFYPNLGNLTVFARDNTNSVVTKLFHVEADGAQQWKRRCVDLPVSQNLTVMFVAQRGHHTQADVAVDDVKLLTNSCANGEDIILSWSVIGKKLKLKKRFVCLTTCRKIWWLFDKSIISITVDVKVIFSRT